jgi:hypothetical protein
MRGMTSRNNPEESVDSGNYEVKPKNVRAEALTTSHCCSRGHAHHRHIVNRCQYFWLFSWIAFQTIWRVD